MTIQVFVITVHFPERRFNPYNKKFELQELDDAMYNLFSDLKVFTNYNKIYLMRKDINIRYGILASIMDTCKQHRLQFDLKSV